jgi:hypothetical protein
LAFIILLIGAIPFSHAQIAQHKQISPYDSRYVVFGFRDDEGEPNLVAFDFNRALLKGKVLYEYKGWVARGKQWQMFLYKEWEGKEESEVLPSVEHLHVQTSANGALEVRVDQPMLDLRLTVEPPRFLFSKGSKKTCAIQTAFPDVELHLQDKAHKGNAVYEFVNCKRSRSNAMSAEKTKTESVFGLFDWILLYDDKGEIWLVSQGTETEDFAYRMMTDGSSAETDKVLIQWLKTRPDTVANQESPERWLVDLPVWNAWIQLEKLGEHRGHGSMTSRGIRPVYAQVSVEGTGKVGGQERRFFGMVELIQD